VLASGAFDIFWSICGLTALVNSQLSKHKQFKFKSKIYRNLTYLLAVTFISLQRRLYRDDLISFVNICTGIVTSSFLNAAVVWCRSFIRTFVSKNTKTRIVKRVNWFEFETARSAETSVSYHITTRRHNPEDHDLKVKWLFTGWTTLFRFLIGIFLFATASRPPLGPTGYRGLFSRE
jgi:hypothetical protein